MTRPLQELLEFASRMVDAEQLAEAAQAFSEIVRLLPTNPDVWAVLARIHLRLGNLDAHDEAIARAIELAPERGTFQLRAALACPPMISSREQIGRVRSRTLERLSALERAPLRIEDIERDIPTLTYFFAYHGEDDREIQRRTCQVIRRMAPYLTLVADHVNPQRSIQRQPTSPLRLGIYSPHLRDHTIGCLFGELVPLLNRSRFTPIVFLSETDTDLRSSVIAQSAAKIVMIPRVVSRAIPLMVAEKLDIMLYPDIGMDAFSTWLACARVAKLQATTWGHPNTTGLDTIDAFFSISDLEPDLIDPPYTERLYTQTFPNIYYRPYRPLHCPDRNKLALPRGRLYGCPQALFKFHPDFDHVLARILESDREGTLVLYAGRVAAWQETLLRRLESRMPGISKRIHWIPHMSRERYIETLSALSVMLDPFPFGGGNTTLEALAVGTAVVTLPPLLARGRLAYTFLRQCGWIDGIATDTEDYIARAIHLARTDSPGQRTAIQECAKILFENTTGISQWEDNLIRAWSEIGFK